MNILTNNILETGTGFWNPLLGLCFFLIIILFVYLIRSLGEKKYKENTEQDLPFFAGNLPSEKSLRVHKIYWGFFEALKGYYRRIKALHTGIVNDYIYWFVLVVVILLIILTSSVIL